MAAAAGSTNVAKKEGLRIARRAGNARTERPLLVRRQTIGVANGPSFFRCLM